MLVASQTKGAGVDTLEITSCKTRGRKVVGQVQTLEDVGKRASKEESCKQNAHNTRDG